MLPGTKEPHDTYHGEDHAMFTFAFIKQTPKAISMLRSCPRSFTIIQPFGDFLLHVARCTPFPCASHTRTRTDVRVISVKAEMERWNMSVDMVQLIKKDIKHAVLLLTRGGPQRLS